MLINAKRPLSAKNLSLIVEKSKFIADLIPIRDELDAKQAIKEIKSRHPKANHHCYGYIIQDVDTRIENQSDDGEPSRTAGLPILEQLRHARFVNTVVVVTRYFGGTLLGTGGLVRAYSEAAKLVIEATESTDIQIMHGYQFTTRYDFSRQIEYMLKQANVVIDSIEYTDAVIFTFYTQNQEIIEQLEAFALMQENKSASENQIKPLGCMLR